MSIGKGVLSTIQRKNSENIELFSQEFYILAVNQRKYRSFVAFATKTAKGVAFISSELSQKFDIFGYLQEKSRN